MLDSTIKLYQLNIPELSGYILEFLQPITGATGQGSFILTGSGLVNVFSQGNVIYIGASSYNLANSGDLTNLYNSLSFQSSLLYYPVTNPSGYITSGALSGISGGTGSNINTGSFVTTGQTGIFLASGNPYIDWTDYTFFGGWTIDSLISNDFIGIANASPTYTLDVNGIIGNSLSDVQIASAQNVYLTFADSCSFIVNNASNNNLLFLSDVGGQGFLGINNVTNPQYNLDINGNLGNSNGDLNINAQGSINLNAGGQLNFTAGAGNNITFNLPIGKFLKIQDTSTNPLLYISDFQNGLIGIKTITPKFQLDVNGTGNFSKGLNASGIINFSGSSFTYNGQPVLTGISGATYITTSQTGQFYSISNPSGFITTGQTGQFLTAGLIVYQTGNQTISGTKTFQNQTVFNHISGVQTNIIYSISNQNPYVSLTTSTIVDAAGNDSILWGDRLLFDNNPSQSLDWQNRFLIDTSSINSLDWSNRLLLDYSVTSSVDWNNRLLLDTSATNSIDWANKFTFDNFGGQGIDWGNNVLQSAGQPVFDWRNGIIYDNDIVFGQQTTIDTNNRLLIRPISHSSVTTSIDWNNLIISGQWTAQGMNFPTGATSSGFRILTTADTGSFGTNTGSFVTTGQTGQFASIINLAATGLTLQNEITSFSGTFNSSGTNVQNQINLLNTWSGNSTGLYYPRTGNPSGFILTSQTGQFYSINNPSGFITGLNTGNFVTTSQTGNFVTNNQTGNFITTSQTGQFANINNLATTGNTIQLEINSLSGTLTSNYATITNLAATGSTLQSEMNQASGSVLSRVYSPIYNDLLLHLPMTEGTGIYTYDSAKGISGFALNCNWTTGFIGQGLQFSHNTGSALIVSGNYPQLTGFSLSAWLYSTGISSTFNMVFSCWGVNNSFYLGQLSQTSFKLTSHNSTGLRVDDSFNTPYSLVNSWHHIGLSYNGTGGTTKAYLDGNLIYTSTLQSGALWPSLGDPMYIGSWVSDANGTTGAIYTWNGTIADPMIFNKVLSDNDFNYIASDFLTKSYIKVNNTGINFYNTGNFVNTLAISGQPISNYFVGTGQTGNFITTLQTGQFYPNLGNPSGFILPSQTGQFISTAFLSNIVFITGSQNISGQKNFNTIIGGTGYFVDTLTGKSIDWGNRHLVFSNVNVVDWNSQILNDNSNIQSLSWVNRQTYNSAGATSIDWQNLWLWSDTFSVLSIDWGNFLLGSGSSNWTLDWGHKILSGNWIAGGLSISGSPVIISSQTGQFASTGNLAATGNTLQLEINTLNSWTGTTNNLYYPKIANPNNYVTGSGSSGYFSQFISPSGISNSILFVTGNNTLAQFNGNTGQTFRMYGGYFNTGTGFWLELQSTGLISTIASGTGAHPLVLGVGRTGILNINTNGNVGVGQGNTSPTAMFDVSVPTSHTDAFRIAYQGAAYNFMRVYSPSADFGFGGGTAIYELPDSNHYLQMSAAAPWYWYSSDPIDFEGNNIYLNATAHAGSNVSIGTTSSATTLEVNGSIGDTANSNQYLIAEFTNSYLCNNAGNFLGVGFGATNAQYSIDIWNGSTPPTIGTSQNGNANYVQLDDGGGNMYFFAQSSFEFNNEVQIFANLNINGFASISNIGWGNFAQIQLNSTTIVDGSANGYFNSLAVGANNSFIVIDHNQNAKLNNITGSGNLIIGGNVTVSGNIISSLNKVSGNFTIPTNQAISLVNVSVSGATGTMPNASGCTGMEFVIKDWKGNSSTKPIIITGLSGQQFDGKSSISININYGSYTLVSDGANWAII